MKINLEMAKEFLEKINKKDKVMIFTHKDLDGFASGILFLDYCKKKGAKVEVAIINYGESRISDTNLNDFNKILIADLAPGMIWEDLGKLENKEILYTDHHPEDITKQIPKNVLELRTTSEGYIPSSRTCYEICGGKKWLSACGVLSDMGQLHLINNNFLEDYYKENKTTYEETFEFVKKISNVIIFLSASIESLYKIANLKKIEEVSTLKELYEPVEKDFARLVKEFSQNKEEFNGIIYFYMESKFAMIKSSFVTGISMEESRKVYVVSTPKIENIISISGRNQSREYNVCKLLQDCLTELKDGFAGGHKVAAGGQVDKSDLETFKERLKQINLEEYRIK